MSTITLSHNRQPSLILPLLLIVGLLLLVAVTIPQVIPNALPGHAEHSEAQEIRNCGNVAAIYINKTCQRFTIVKELEQGRYGGQVVQPCKRGILEVTVYLFASAGKPLDLKMIDVILKAKGCIQVTP